MKGLLRIVWYSFLWCGVAAFILYAAHSVRRARRVRLVKSIEIAVVDSSAQGHLVTSQQVREWIAASGLVAVGFAADSVDIAAIERLIAGNGFVGDVVAYFSYDGVLNVSVSRRKPVARLLTDGRNSYVTAEGVVFDAPERSSLYVPVITGPYSPPFAADFTGDVRHSIDAAIAECGRRIDEIEREKYPHLHAERRNNLNIRELRRRRIKQEWWRFESDSMFELRVEALREEKAVLRRRYRYIGQQIDLAIERIEARQQAERDAQKKLEKNYEDFINLLTFVEWVEHDDFWRSEVVQVVARTAHSGALEVDLVPRSGRHTIRFGRLEDIEEKFAKLRRLYDGVFMTEGWERFGEVDLRYGGQVVCR